MSNVPIAKKIFGPKSRRLILGSIDKIVIDKLRSLNSEIDLSGRKGIKKLIPLISVIVEMADRGQKSIEVVALLPLVVEAAAAMNIRCQLPTAYKAYGTLIDVGLLSEISNSNSHRLNQNMSELPGILDSIINPPQNGCQISTHRIRHSVSKIEDAQRVVHLSKNNTSLISTLMSILPCDPVEFQEGVINVNTSSLDGTCRSIPYKLRTYTDSGFVSVMLREDAEVYIAIINVCYQSMVEGSGSLGENENISSTTEFHIDSVARFLHPHTTTVRNEHRRRIRGAIERIQNTALDLEELLSIDASDIARFPQIIDNETKNYIEQNKSDGIDVIQSTSVRFVPFAQCQKKVVITKANGVVKAHDSSTVYQVQLGKQIERNITSNENEWLYIIPPSLLGLMRHHGFLFDLYMECRYRYNRLQPDSEFTIYFMQVMFPNGIVVASKSKREAIYLKGKNKFRTTLNQIRKQSKQTQERNNISCEPIKRNHYKLSLCGYECCVSFTDETMIVKPNQEAILKATNTTRKSPTITNALAGKSLTQHKIDSGEILKLVDNIHFDRNGFVTTVRFSGTETEFTVVHDSALREEIAGEISGTFDVSLSVASKYLAENDYEDTITCQGYEMSRNDISNAFSKYKVLAKNMKITEPLETFIDLLESEDNDAHELILNLIG